MYLNVLFVVFGVFVNIVMGTNVTDTLRVVGGSPIPNGEMPNLVYVKSYIVVNEGEGLTYSTCSGALINAGLYPELFPRVKSEFFVITAAHCVLSLEVPYQILSRIEILWNPDDKIIENMKTYDTGTTIIHPEYNNYIVAKAETSTEDIVGYSAELYNDIAIVEVFIEGEDEWINKLIKVDFTKDISDFPSDEKYIQAGFGAIVKDKPLPDRGYWYTNANVYSHSETINQYNTKYGDNIKTLFVNPLIINNRFKIVLSKPGLFYAAGGDSGGALWVSDKKSIVGITSTLMPGATSGEGSNSYTTISIFLKFIQTAVDQFIPLKDYSVSYYAECNETLESRNGPVDYIENYFSNKGIMSPYLDYAIFDIADEGGTDYEVSHYLPDYNNLKIFGSIMYIPTSQSPSPIDYVNCLKNGILKPDKCLKKLVKYQQTSYKSGDFVVNTFLERTYNVMNSGGDIFRDCYKYAVADQFIRVNDNRYKICKVLPNWINCKTIVPEYEKQVIIRSDLLPSIKNSLNANPKACENKRVVWIRNNDFQSSKNSYYEYCNVIPIAAEFPIGNFVVNPLICLQWLNYP
jgi:hypothetical protein